MVKVKFLQDFRGKATKEIYYLAGTVAEFDEATAKVLIDENRVEIVNPEEKPKRKVK